MVKKAASTLKYTTDRGEPMLWGIQDTSREGIKNFLSKFGLELVEHISPKESDDFFLRRSDGVLTGECLGFLHFIIAKVP